MLIKLLKRYRARKYLNSLVDEWRLRAVVRSDAELFASGARVCGNCYFWRRSYSDLRRFGRCQNSGNWEYRRVSDSSGIVHAQSPIALRPVVRLIEQTCPLFVLREETPNAE